MKFNEATFLLEGMSSFLFFEYINNKNEDNIVTVAQIVQTS